MEGRFLCSVSGNSEGNEAKEMAKERAKGSSSKLVDIRRIEQQRQGGMGGGNLSDGQFCQTVVGKNWCKVVFFCWWLLEIFLVLANEPCKFASCSARDGRTTD